MDLVIKTRYIDNARERTSKRADDKASALNSASFTGILPAASKRLVAASQLKAWEYSFVSGSGECVRA